jgi:sugar phosphate permease
VTLRRARLTVLLVPATLYFVSYFHRVAPAVVADDLMRAFAIGAASLGTLAAIYPYVFAAMALVAGSLADTLGPRWTMALGGTTMGLGSALFGVAPTFGVAFTGRLLVGVGASVILISWLSLAAEWFRPGEFGTVSGFTQAVGNVGALVASSPLALLVEAAGWRTTFVLIGAVTVGLGGLAGALVRDQPAGLGLPLVNPERGVRRAASLAETLRGIGGVVRNARTWPPILVAGGVYMGLITFVGLWGVRYLAEVYGLRRVEAANLTALAALGLCVGSPLVGWLSDRWLQRRRLPMALFTLLFTTSWVPLLLPSDQRLSPAALAPFVFLLGLTASGMVLVWPCVREVNDPGRVGIAVGFVNMPIFLGFAVMQWLTGTILDAAWGGLVSAGARVYPPDAYRTVFGLCFAISLGALTASWFVTETRCRSVWTASAAPG